MDTGERGLLQRDLEFNPVKKTRLKKNRRGAVRYSAKSLAERGRAQPRNVGGKTFKEIERE